MLANVSVSYSTYLTFQTVLVLLTIVSTTVTLWRMRRGSNKEDVLSSADKIMGEIGLLREEVAGVKGDVENTTQRLEAHIDRTQTRRKAE